MRYWRVFLQNPNTGTDSYVVVSSPQGSEDESIMLKVADCERNVRLWFGWGSNNSIKISRKKLEHLKEALDRVEANLDRLEKVHET